MDGQDCEQDDDVEVEDVVIEFEGNFDLDGLVGKQVQLIGIDTKEPVLKIDSRFYKIDAKDSIGSRLIFKQEESNEEHNSEQSQQQQQQQQNPPQYEVGNTNSKTSLRYLTKTDKVITASRVMIKPYTNTRTERVLPRNPDT